MPRNPLVSLPSAAVLLLTLGCGGEPPAASPAPQPSPPAAPDTAPPTAPAPAASATVTDPFGYYFLEGDLPAWAQGIDHLHLSTIDMKGEEMVTVPLWGFLRWKEEAGGRDQRLENVRLEGQALSFTTQEIEGVSFAFEGSFQVAGELPAQAPEGIVLQGRLRRLEHGGPAGEIEARFAYSPGD